MKRIYFLLPLVFITLGVCSQFSLTTSPYMQNFNGLGTASSTGVTGGNLNIVNAALNGWYINEAGSSGNNTTITAGTGSSSTADTYNFGLAADADRTLGGIQSSTLRPSYGFYFTNNSGSTITTLQIGYTGKTWRVGSANRSDRLDFAYSANATSLITGNWTDVNALDYANPGQATGSGSVLHSASVNSIILNLNIAVGNTFFIRWTDVETGNDDGMGIDDLTLTVITPVFTSFYSKPSGNLTDVATWGTNPDGTGTAPSNFTANFQIFNITNRVSTTLNANWIVSGAGSKVITGNGASATTFTIPISAILTGTVDVTNLATLVLQNNTLPVLGISATGSTVSYEQSGTFSVAEGSYHNLILKGGTKGLGFGNIIVTGNFTLDGVTGFAGISSPPFSNLILSGNFTLQNGAAFATGGSLIDNYIILQIVGSGTQTLSGGNFQLKLLQTPATPATTLNIALSNANLFLGGQDDGDDNGLMLQQASHTLSLNGNTLTLQNDGFIYTGAVPGTISGSSSSSVVININPGGGSAENPILRFTPGAQVLGTLNILSISNLIAPPALGSPLSINTNINFAVDTRLISTNTNLLTILANATITGVALHTKLVGPMARVTNAAGDYSFPLFEKPLTIGVQAGGNPATFRAEYFSQGTNVNAQICFGVGFQGFTAFEINEYWDITRISGSSAATVSLDYDGATQDNNWSNNLEPSGNSTGMVIAHYNTAPLALCWESSYGSVAADIGQQTITSEPFNNFSPFTIGYINFGGPLPVKFANVKAYQQGNGVRIDWSNFTESDVVNYKIERSSNGIDFIPLSAINAALNNGGRADYSYKDASPINGVNFYRIQSLETDGKKLYSVIVRVDTKNGTIKITIYPNPVTDGQFVLQTPDLKKGVYNLNVFNSTGQKVYTQLLNHTGGFVTQSVQLPSSVKPGLYHLQLIGDEGALTKTFIIQ